MEKVAIGSDHGGYALKQRVIRHLEERGIPYEDMGCHGTESCDYPAFGRAVAKAVAGGSCEKGIVICTTGIGISIAANKVAGIRCALCGDSFSAKMTRLHNDANVLDRSHRKGLEALECNASKRCRTGIGGTKEWQT